MNIFFLDRDIRRAVRYHCDQHVVKMPLETAQILCTVLHRYNVPAPYKPTHTKHPSVLWAGDSRRHFRWLVRFGLALCDEYTFRYGKEHASRKIIEGMPKPGFIPANHWRDPPQAMPDEFKAEDAVEAYRAFYRGEKVLFKGKGAARWTRRRVPFFMRDLV